MPLIGSQPAVVFSEAVLGSTRRQDLSVQSNPMIVCDATYLTAVKCRWYICS